MLKARFVFKIFKFYPDFLENGVKRMVNFKIYDTGWETNNYNTHVDQYLKKKRPYLVS